MLPGTEHLSYEERLGFSLQQKLRGELMEVYRIMRGRDRMDRKQLPSLVEGSIMRGRSFKVRGRGFEGRFFHPEGGGNLECAAWEGSGGRKPHNL